MRLSTEAMKGGEFVHYQQDLIEYIYENYKTKSIREISIETGVDRKKITDIYKINGFTINNKRLSQEDIAFILDNATKSSSDLSKEISVPASTIRRLWNTNGIFKKQSFNPDKAEFELLYRKLSSSRKVAKHYGVDKTSVLNYAKK